MKKLSSKIKSDCYCIRLRRAANTVSHLYDCYLDSVGLSITQYSLLSNLRKIEHCSVTDLANRIGLERTTVVRTLRPLLERGLIEDISADRQRNRILNVTEKGLEVLSKSKVMWNDAQSRIEQRIGEDRVNTMLELLDLLSEV